MLATRAFRAYTVVQGRADRNCYKVNHEKPGRVSIVAAIGAQWFGAEVTMRTSTLTTLSAAVLIAVASAAQAGGGAYFGGGGGGRGMSGGGMGGGFGGARGMSSGGGGAMSAPSATYGSRSGGSSGRHPGNWNGGNGRHGNWNGHHGHGHGHGHGYWYGGWYYPYWWWPTWGATIAVGTWPYWSGTWVDPYYYPNSPYYYYYGPPSGTIIYRDQPGQTTPGPGQAAPQTAPGQATPPAQPFRLYCPATNQYYPDVGECSQQWLKVVPNDGAAPSPAQPAPQSGQPQAYEPLQPARGTPQKRAPEYIQARTTASSTMSTSITTSAAMRVREPGMIAVASHAGSKIPAPRMAVPASRIAGTVVAQASVE